VGPSSKPNRSQDRLIPAGICLQLLDEQRRLPLAVPLMFIFHKPRTCSAYSKGGALWSHSERRPV